MKVILEFDNIDDANFAINGPAYSTIIDQLDEWMRSESKYKDKVELPVSQVREKLAELLEEYI